LHSASPAGPHPAEPAPESSRPEARTPADFAAQFASLQEPNVRNVVTRYSSPLQRPGHFNYVGTNNKYSRSKSEPGSGIDRNYQQSWRCQERFPERHIRQKYNRYGEQDQREDQDQRRHPSESKGAAEGRASARPVLCSVAYNGRYLLSSGKISFGASRNVCQILPTVEAVTSSASWAEAALQDALRTAGPESRFTVHGSPCSLLFDYAHEQEANRNSPVAT
jgi:hypothetical protein